MVRRPNTTHTLIQTGNRLLGAFQLVSASILEDHCLLEDVFGLKVAHTDGLLIAVDVLSLNHGVLLVSWGNADLDLRVLFREFRKGLGQEGAVGMIPLAPIVKQKILVGHVQHAARAAAEVAVMEIKALALEDEGTDAIL